MRKGLDQQLMVVTRGAEVLKVSVAQIVKRDSFLDTGKSVELIIQVWAEAKEVAANAVEGYLEVHSIPASTSGGLRALHHFQQVGQKIPTEYFLVDTEEYYSENLASETHIELAGS